MFRFILFLYSLLLSGILNCNAGDIIPFSSTPGVHAIYRGLWAVFDNPAGCAQQTSFTAGAAYHSTFLLNEMAEQSFAVLLPIKKAGTTGLGYQQYGYSLYKEQRACLLFSRSFGTQVDAGVRLDYLSTRFGNDYGHSSAFTGSAGILFRITEPVRVGVSVFNPQRAALSKDSDTRYPAVMEAGVSWTFRSGAELAFGISKTVDRKEILITGLRYPVSKKFLLHASLSGGRDRILFGYSFRFSVFEIGMASGYHQDLGFSPGLMLTFQSK
jgi:hypothetical protein